MITEDGGYYMYRRLAVHEAGVDEAGEREGGREDRQGEAERQRGREDRRGRRT